MAISIALTGSSTGATRRVFDTVIDLRHWDEHAGVMLRGPAQPIVVGDRVDVTLQVVGRDIRCGLLVDVVEPPADGPGLVRLRTVDGPVHGEMTGTVAGTPGGCELRVAVDGHARGAARFVERPLELVARRWASHQLHHLLAVARSSAPG